ncbi:MAG: hypothetical protein F4X26_09855 [Chloroflexi bacterium]|nr:hypothetical protein [Chloroflexota bacterium]
MASQAEKISDPDSRVIEVNDDTLILDGAYEHRAVPSAACSEFGESVWDLPPHVLDLAGEHQTINWMRFPSAFRVPIKRLALALLRRLPALEMVERRSNLRPALAPSSVVSLVEYLVPFATWLAERGIDSFSEVDDEMLHEYSDSVISEPRISSAVKHQRLWAVSRIWLHGQYLRESERLRRPYWESPEGPSLRDIVPPGSPSGENTTEPIDPDTIGMLFKWCEWFIFEASHDIERAVARRDEILSGFRERAEPGDAERWKQYLEDLRANDGALPGRVHGGREVMAGKYVAAKVGVGMKVATRPADIRLAIGTPLGVEIEGRLAGQPWTDDIDFHEVDGLVRNLAAACLVTIAYLTGMRGKEARALERGCCHRIDRGDGLPPGYEIHGHKFKAAGEDGTWVPGGQQRDFPWPGVVPVPQAVAAISRLHHSDLLFPQTVFTRHVFKGRPPNAEVAVSKNEVRYAMAHLIEWCNETAMKRALPEAVIPPDPLGNVTIMRLRRTMAWFVAHQPYGRLSLGTLFEHVGFRATDGYGTQIFTGQRSPYSMDEASAIAERFAAAQELLEAGERVSGPAAERFLDTFWVLAQFEGMALDIDELQTLIDAGDGFDVHGNPFLHLHCHYDPSRALCHPERMRGARKPSLSHCKRECANVVYTDSDIAAIRGEVRMLRAEAQTPGTSLPRVVRCDQLAEQLEEIIVDHERDRVGLEGEES